VPTTCADVWECVDALTNKVHVAQQEFPPFKQFLPVHFWIGDATGKVVIAGYVGGKTHDRPRQRFQAREHHCHGEAPDVAAVCCSCWP
jgi:penicillin V acylase-like amidase (Ntn superfamily)